MDTSKKNNAEYRKAFSHVTATKTLSKKVFKGQDFEEKKTELDKQLINAITFHTEVKNLFSNLEDTSMNLAIQLKAMMLNAKLYNLDTE